MPGLGVWSYLHSECKGRSLEGLFKKESCHVCLNVTELPSSPKICWGACNPWEPFRESLDYLSPRSVPLISPENQGITET